MAIKFLDSIDITGGEIQNVLVQNLAADPTGLGAGQIYYNTNSNALKYYNGSAWTTLAAWSRYHCNDCRSSSNRYP